jgi:hypothetical protein
MAERKKRRSGSLIAEAARVRARRARRPPTEAERLHELEIERVSVRQANFYDDSQRFWGVAASLGGQLVGEGLERTTNPLVWVAALEMAKEKVLSMGGEAMASDWQKAQEWRAKAATAGTTFLIMEAPEGFEDDDGSA